MLKNLNILYQCSDAFAFLVGVSITSLLHNNDDIFFNIYIFGDKLSDLSANRFYEIANNNKEMCNITLIDATKCDSILEQNNIRKWKNSYATYYKLFFHFLLPELKKPLFYIDADTIILKKLDGLIDFDFQGNVLSMLRVNTSSKHMKDIQMDSNSSYYAGGIIYFNTKLWISNNYEQLIIDNLRKNNLDSLADQDIINYTFENKILSLPVAYNFTQYSFLFSENIKKIWPKQEYKIAKKEPIIIHYATGFLGKPWETNYEGCFGKEWIYYQLKSPWSDFILVQPFNNDNATRFIKFLKKIFPNFLFNFCYSIYRIYRNI